MIIPFEVHNAYVMALQGYDLAMNQFTEAIVCLVILILSLDHYGSHS